MSSIKVKFRPSTVAEREGTIYYQIIHERKVRQLLTRYHIFSSEWDETRSKISADQTGDRTKYLQSIRRLICKDIERLSTIVRRFEAEGLTYSSDDIVDEYCRYIEKLSLFNFMEATIAKHKQNNKARTSEAYRTTLSNFRRFRDGKDIMLDCISSEVMESYEAWQKGRNIALNTISFYMRILRAVYNRAVEEGVMKNLSPFRHVYTGIDKTVKRALSLATMKKIKALDLSQYPEQEYARDMFLLSFYLRGMSLVDMSYLKKSDLRDGYIVYRRRKTGRLMVVEWTKEMQQLLDKYPENKSCYLLPIIRNNVVNERSCYRNMGYNINHNLKVIAKKVGINTPLTLYVARHSWASAARSKGIPISVISEGMGHESETTTQIYLASIGITAVNRANAIIMKSL